jgi:hypothetical protein
MATPTAERRSRLRHVRRVGIFLAGLVCILAGIALAVLPGPLTIPPVLLGLYLWSLEFEFAARFFDSMKEKADDAWAQAKRKPVMSALLPGGGGVPAPAAIWAVLHFELVDKGKDAVGL